MLHTIRWRIAVPYLALILLIMAGLTLYLSDWVQQTHLEELEAKLTAEAVLIGDAVGSSAAWESADDGLDGMAQHYADLLDARVTFIGAEGIVLGESHGDRKRMDNHLQRPEVQQALETGKGSSKRLSRTMGYQMMYVAIPVTEPATGELRCFARVALPLRQIELHDARLRRTVFSAALLTALGATLLALFIANRIARPIYRLTDVVKRMSEGELSARIFPTTQDEIGTLTSAFNQMSARLQDTIETLTEDQSRLAAVLKNMADGVLITDSEGLVQLINPAAANILGADESVALGRSFAQVARDHRIINLWQQCREHGQEQVEPVEMGHQGAFLQTIVTPLQDTDPQACLVIFQDLTRIRRLETVRRDFISNISHELRTPLASLRAVADTLRDGALEDPPAARHFLDRMDTEVDALTQIVQELLQLSRIESGRAPIRLAPVSVAGIVIPAVERLRPQAERANLRLSMELPRDLPPALADTERMQQVVTNLVHNAIKFTPAGGEIKVSGSRVQVSADGTIQSETLNLKPEPLSPGLWILITVEDTGVGIPADDLPRIFERFYKADRARSGGGTGLGLAIAKHIVQAHGGRIWVESVEGKGSTFYVGFQALTSP